MNSSDLNLWRDILMENAPDAIIGINSNDVILDWNTQAEAIFGWDKTETYGRKLSELINPNNEGEQLLPTTSRPNIFQRIAFKKDGKKVPIEIRTVPIESKDIIYCFMRDLTQKHEDRLKMIESQVMLEALLDISPILISFVDSDLRYVFMNRRFEKWLPIDTTQVKGKTVSEVLGEDYFRRTVPYMQLALQGQEVDFESNLIADGSRKHFEVRYIPFKGTGTLKGFFVIGFDITERKNRELDQKLLSDLAVHYSSGNDVQQLIRLTCERLGSHLEVERAFLLEMEENSQIVHFHDDFSSGLPSLKGDYDLKDFSGPVIAQLREHDQVLVNDVTSDSRTRPQVEALLRFNMAAYISVPLFHAGRLAGALSVSSKTARIWSEREKEIVRSIAEALWAKVENVRLLKALENAVKAREEFISVCSHELKTPLTSMILQVQLASKLIEKDDPAALTKEAIVRRIEVTSRQLERMARLVEDMLDVSRISAGKLSCEFRPLDLNEVVTETSEKFKEQFEALRIDFSFTPTAPVWIMADKARLDQVISNLLTNAIKYGLNRPIHIAIDRVGEEFVQLKVSDQGIGIPAESMERIFQRFERADITGQISGLGLGLYISKEIVKHHDGRIWVESSLGRGSTFIVELPLIDESII